MPGGDKAGTVSGPCGFIFPLTIPERGKQLCFASLMRNACSCIYTGDNDYACCRLFCSLVDPQRWLPKPLPATPALPSRALCHCLTRARAHSVSPHTPLCFSFLFGFLSLYCFKLVAGLGASLNFICLSSSSSSAPLLVSPSIPRSDTVYFLCCFPNVFVGTVRDIITSC